MTPVASVEHLTPDLAPQAAPGVWEAVLSLAPVSGRILNAGAGRGGLSLLLRNRGLDVVSIDLHPEHFAAPGLSCQHQDLLQPLSFASQSFDVVCAVEVMEHLENPWLFFREAIRVLKPGGRLVFTSPNVQSLASRMCLLRGHCPPFFRDESFRGCYHVTPIFDWAVARCCETTDAEVVHVGYSRTAWPRCNDVPRVWVPRLHRLLWWFLPRNRLFGEIAIYCVRKTGRAGKRVEVGVHCR